METLATLLTAVLKGMRLALGPYVNSAKTPVLRLAYDRIARAAIRFQSLFARWQTNTLPTPRPSHAGQPYTPRPKPYFPTRHAWLAGSTDHHVRGRASQLEHLIASPDMAEFLTQVPRAGRILRPLCQMLGITMPAALLLLPSPRSRGEPEGRQPHPKPTNPNRETPPPLLPLYPQRRPRPMPFMDAIRKSRPA